jgi:hypothetical protein
MRTLATGTSLLKRTDLVVNGEQPVQLVGWPVVGDVRRDT